LSLTKPPNYSPLLTTPFYIGAAILVGIGFGAIFLDHTTSEVGGWTALCVGVIMFVIPTLLEARHDRLWAKNEYVEELKRSLADLRADLLAHSIEPASSEFITGSNTGNTGSSTDKSLINEDAWRPLIEELRDKRIEVIQLKSEVKDWETTAISFIQGLERLQSMDEISTEYKRAVNLVLKNGLRAFAARGFILIRPERGEKFDDEVHAFDGFERDEDLTINTIIKCTRWGFRGNSIGIVKAGVVLTKEPALSKIQDASQQTTNSLKDCQE
jgi:hypothetical protein